MLSLRSLREVGDAMEREEVYLQKEETLEQRVTTFLSLYRASFPFFAETKDLFLPEREQHLVQLQSRLQKLDEWRRNQT